MRTLRTSRPATKGHRSGAAISQRIGLGKPAATGGVGFGFKRPAPAAARSRAMPRTPSQSGRLGVTSKSITGSKSKARAAETPTASTSGSSTMPSRSSEISSSRAEQSIPMLTTPRTDFSTSVTPSPGTCAPMGA